MKRATRKVEPKTPTTLPMTSPAMTPSATASVRVARKPPSTNRTPEAKNANTGTATPAEMGRIRCSNRWATSVVRSWVLIEGTDARGLTGTTSPRSIPATVACTPDACTRPHVANARGSSSHQ